MKKIYCLLNLLCFVASFSQVLDLNFGQQGIASTTVGNGFGYITALARQTDDKIVGCGKYQQDGINKLAVIRYNSGGTIDPFFGENGVVLSEVTLSDTFLEFPCLKLQNDGKILIGARYVDQVPENISDIKLIRLNTDGSYDAGFGTDGTVTISLLNLFLGVYAIEIQPDGKIVIAGWSDGTSTRDNFEVFRLNSNGSLDNTFGNHGRVSLNIGYNTTTPSNDLAATLKILDNGKIIVGGHSDASVLQYMQNFAIVRLNADGSLDTTFGTAGKVLTDFGKRDMITSMAVTADGHILVSGRLGAEISNNNDLTFSIGLAKYDMQGQPDASFGIGGQVITEIESSLYSLFTNDMFVQPDNKILLAGTIFHATGEILLVRYHPDGSLDTTFGNDGIFIREANSGSELGCTLLSLPGESFIVGGGSNFQTTSSDFALYKFNGDSLSMTEFSNESVRIYPNPARHFLNITTLNGQSVENTVICDVTGKTVFRQSGNLSKIDVQNFEPGIYWIQIQFQGKTNIQKFIKE